MHSLSNNIVKLLFLSGLFYPIERRILNLEHILSDFDCFIFFLFQFFGAMSLLYLAYAIGWLLASCCNWRDLLRLQVCICPQGKKPISKR